MSKLINSVPPSASTTANSFAMFVQNLGGYLPAPFVYGLIQDLTGGETSRWGLFSLQCSGILAISFLIILAITESRQSRALIKNSKNQTTSNALLDLDKSHSVVNNLLDFETGGGQQTAENNNEQLNESTSN